MIASFQQMPLKEDTYSIRDLFNRIRILLKEWIGTCGDDTTPIYSQIAIMTE